MVALGLWLALAVCCFFLFLHLLDFIFRFHCFVRFFLPLGCAVTVFFELSVLIVMGFRGWSLGLLYKACSSSWWFLLSVLMIGL